MKKVDLRGQQVDQLKGQYILLIDDSGVWDLYEFLNVGVTSDDSGPAFFIRGQGLMMRSPEPRTFYRNGGSGANNTTRYFCKGREAVAVIPPEDVEHVIEQLREAEQGIRAAVDRFKVMAQLLVK